MSCGLTWPNLIYTRLHWEQKFVHKYAKMHETALGKYICRIFENIGEKIQENSIVPAPSLLLVVEWREKCHSV